MIGLLSPCSVGFLLHSWCLPLSLWIPVSTIVCLQHCLHCLLLLYVSNCLISGNPVSPLRREVQRTANPENLVSTATRAASNENNLVCLLESKSDYLALESESLGQARHAVRIFPQLSTCPSDCHIRLFLVLNGHVHMSPYSDVVMRYVTVWDATAT